MTQKDSWEWEDSLIAYCKDYDQSDDELIAEYKYVKLVSEMLLWTV